MLIAFFAMGILNPPSENTQQFDLPSNILSGDNQYYLCSPPNYPNNSYKITKIFLENVTAYDYSNTSSVAGVEFTVHDGMSLFIINGTVRNDYSPSEILKSSHEGISHCTIGLDVYLYDAQGNFLNTLNRGNTFRGSCELLLRGSEKTDFEAIFVTPVENVAYFEIYVSFLDPLPLF